MPFIAVKNLHQRTILEVLFLLVHFYTMMCELSEQTTFPTITHISHNSARVSLSSLDLIFNARQLKNR